MTPEQIAEKIRTILYKDLWADDIGIDGFDDAINDLIQLITTLQKETWDAACKAQREFDFVSGAIDNVERRYAPFNPEK